MACRWPLSWRPPGSTCSPLTSCASARAAGSPCCAAVRGTCPPDNGPFVPPSGARIGREILRLAERQGDAGMLVDGHLVVGLCISSVDGIAAGLEHLDEAIAQLRAGPVQSRPFRLGNNAGTTCFTTSAFFLWTLGYPDKGRGAGRRSHQHGHSAGAPVHPCLRPVPLQLSAPVVATA